MAERVVGREQVLAFRASAQSLDRRRPATELAGVAGACGVQDTPPGNADVSLAARLDVDGPVVKEAVASKELVLAWSLRGAPHVFPPEDFAVFTLGARPADDTLEALWGEPERVPRRGREGDGRPSIGSEPSPKGEVSAAVTAALPAELTPWCTGCDVHHPRESVFRATPLLGRLVLTSTAPVLLTRAKTWLGADAKGDLDALRTELLRRYLHCYAPTTSGHFAEWAGITKADAKQRWAAVADAPRAGAREPEGVRAGGGPRRPRPAAGGQRRAPAPGQGRVPPGPGPRPPLPRSRPPQGRLPDDRRPRRRAARGAPGRAPGAAPPRASATRCGSRRSRS